VNNWFPLVRFEPIASDLCNALLDRWGHKMGPLARPFPSQAHALYHVSDPVCVVTHSCLIAPHVADGLGVLTRENTIEVSRLCAVRPGLCRVGLRLWREFVFPALGYPWALSYQDADLHSGNTYRFDGWERVGFSHSGSDKRSGAKGRNKWIWIWPKGARQLQQKADA
jgi:antitoxin VapB